MYKICRTVDTYSDPVTTFCPVASLVDDENKFADLCIYAEGTSVSKLFVNSRMLLSALENSAELLNELAKKHNLNVTITPLKKAKAVKEVVVVEPESIPEEEPEVEEAPVEEQEEVVESAEIPEEVVEPEEVQEEYEKPKSLKDLKKGTK